jgi:hypothetical protein
MWRCCCVGLSRPVGVVEKKRRKRKKRERESERKKAKRSFDERGLPCARGWRKSEREPRTATLPNKNELTSSSSLPSFRSSSLSLPLHMALHEFPDHLVAEIAKYLDAASDVLALERALEVASAFPSTFPSKATPTTTTAPTKPSRSSSRSKQGHSRSKQTEELSSPTNQRIDVESVTKCFLGRKKPGTGRESPAREPDASDDGNNAAADDDDDATGKNADDADELPLPPPPLFLLPPVTPTPPSPSLLEEVLRLRWRDAWVLAGLPREAGVEAGVACAYAAALAAAGGPRVRTCALFAGGPAALAAGDGRSDGGRGSDEEDEDAGAAAATEGLFGMEMSPPPPSPSSVFFLLDPPPCCCGGGASPFSSKRGKHSRLASAPAPFPSLPYRHLPPASAIAAALEALSLDAPRLKQAARLAVAADLGPEPPLLRRAYRGHSYSPPEERGGLLLSEEEEEEEFDSGEVAAGVRTPSPSSRSSSSSSSRSSRSPPPLRARALPRLGEVSAEFLAWQTAAGHLASAFSSRLARCAAAARGKIAARELAKRRSEEEEEETETERKGKEAAVAA